MSLQDPGLTTESGFTQGGVATWTECLASLPVRLQIGGE